MCGIVGILADTTDIGHDFEATLERLAHRGPDARGSYKEEGMVLGHLRLSIIDLSDAANQPMHSHCNRYVMVYNGEVYNFKEIEADIKKERGDFAPNTSSDTEIILEAFATWNTGFAERLNGMFAIAIWDKHEKKLFLFRDRMGIKPIYYFHEKGIFAFGSELKVLKEEPMIKKHLTIDYTAINQYLHLGYIPAPRSIYSQIKKFPQGHYAVVSDGNILIKPFWKPEEKVLKNRVAKKCNDYLEELQQLLESSVKYRLIADVPFGTFLSGGIDSSIVTAVASKVQSQPLNTFSIGFWDKEYDESRYAMKVAQYLGTSHHSLQVTEADALEWMPEITSIYDEPYADSSAIPTLLVSKMARKFVTMTLSGDGGDELFMGYGAYKWAQRLANPVMPFLRLPASALLRHGPVKYRRTASLFRNVPDHQLKSHIFSQEQYLFSRKEVRQVLKSSYLRDYSLNENFTGHLADLNPAEQQALFDLKYYLPDDLLVKVDRASMHFALETRVPLLDYRIVEWALNLPVEMKMNKGQSKWLLRQLLFRYVPEHFFNRPKRGFAIPLQKWLRKELKGFAMDYLNDAAIEKAGVLNPVAVKALLNDFYKEDQHYLYNKIWLLVVLQKWLLN